MDPARDAEVIHTELVLADLQTVEKAMKKKRSYSTGRKKKIDR